MERALETDDAEAFRLACVIHRPAHHLDHALVRFGARVAEENAVGEGGVDKALGQFLGLRDAVQVGGVHHLAGLFGDRLHEVGIGMAEAGGGDAGAEIEESSAVCRPQPSALAPLECEVGTCVVRQQRGYHPDQPWFAFPQRIARPRPFGAGPDGGAGSLAIGESLSNKRFVACAGLGGGGRETEGGNSLRPERLWASLRDGG